MEIVALQNVTERNVNETRAQGYNQEDSSEEISPIFSNTSYSLPEEESFPDGGLKAYLALLGSFLGLMANFGLFNSIGAIQSYISIHQLATVDASTVSWIFSIYMYLSLGIGILVGPYFDRKGSFHLLALGTVLSFGGFMALASSRVLWQFILSLSVCIAIGSAMCITPLIGVISHWFFIHRGSAMGAATIGGSVGGIVIPLMLRSLYPKLGYPWAIRILGFFCLGCSSISTFLARERISKPKSALPDRKKNNVLSKPFHIFDTLKDLKYSFLIAAVFTNELSLMLVVTYYASYGTAQGMSESSSYLLLTIYNASGVLGRLIPGFVSDKLGKFNVMALMLIGVVLSNFLLWIPFGSNFKILYAYAVTAGFCSASILSLTPVCIGVITPVHEFGKRYGILYFFTSIADLFGIPLGAAIIGNGSQHGYKMFSVFCGALSFVGTAFFLASRYCIVGSKLNVKI